VRWIDYENRRPTDAFPGWTPWTGEKWNEWLAKSAKLLEDMRVLNKEAETFKAQGNATGATTKRIERNEIITAKGAHWGELKPWLLALSYGKCWFSDTKDLFSHYDVEHYRPKKEANDDENPDGEGKAVTRDGYWWLAFDYCNFRVCGNVGNRKKGGWFPLRLGSVCSQFTERCEETESPYFIDPINPADVDLVAFDERGDMIPKPGASEWEAKRVEISAKRIKLNQHEELTEARKKLWQELTREIEGYLTQKQRAASGNNPGAREKLAGHIRNIRRRLQPSESLSSVAQWCVSFRNDSQLSKLTS